MWHALRRWMALSEYRRFVRITKRGFTSRYGGDLNGREEEIKTFYIEGKAPIDAILDFARKANLKTLEERSHEEYVSKIRKYL